MTAISEVFGYGQNSIRPNVDNGFGSIASGVMFPAASLEALAPPPGFGTWAALMG